MSSTDDKATPDCGGAASSKSLVLVKQEGSAFEGAPEQASSAPRSFMSRAPRLILPVALLALTGGLGWYAGAQSGAASFAEQRALLDSSLGAELRAQSGKLAALEAQLTKIESAPGAEASLKPAIDILARRIDEIARRQTASLAQTSSRFDRSDKELGARLDQMSERIERIEKQVSSPAPVSSTQKNVTSVMRSASAQAAPAEPVERAIRGYVLRDVFRGGALIESRHGLMEVFPGAQLPGAGLVRSVEQRDGRWVVVTTTGLIEARH
jgi:hypothetical protein